MSVNTLVETLAVAVEVSVKASVSEVFATVLVVDSSTSVTWKVMQDVVRV